MNLIFGAISQLTGGLINDLTTAIIGMFVISFIVMGFDYLKNLFENHINKMQTNKHLDRARTYQGLAESMEDKVSRDYLNSRYRNEIRKASSL